MDNEATDFVVLWSSDSGRAYGVSVDRQGGEEVVNVTELRVRKPTGYTDEHDTPDDLRMVYKDDGL